MASDEPAPKKARTTAPGDTHQIGIGIYQEDVDPRGTCPEQPPKDRIEMLSVTAYLKSRQQPRYVKSSDWVGSDFGAQKRWPRALVKVCANAFYNHATTLCRGQGPLERLSALLNSYSPASDRRETTAASPVDPDQAQEDTVLDIKDFPAQLVESLRGICQTRESFNEIESHLQQWLEEELGGRKIDEAQKDIVRKFLVRRKTFYEGRSSPSGGEDSKSGDRTLKRYLTFLRRLHMIKDYPELFKRLNLYSIDSLTHRKQSGQESRDNTGVWQPETASECAKFYTQRLEDIAKYPFNGSEDDQTNWQNEVAGVKLSGGETCWADLHSYDQYLEAHDEESCTDMDTGTVERAGVGGVPDTMANFLVRCEQDRVISLCYIQPGRIVGFLRGELYYGPGSDIAGRIHVVNGVFFEPAESHMYPIFKGDNTVKGNLTLVYETVPDPNFGKGPCYRIAAITRDYIAPLTTLFL